MRITVQSDVDTIPFTGYYTDPHCVWGIRKDGIQGLFGTPGMKESFEPMPQQDGDYWPSRITQKGRTITLDLVCRWRSSIENARNRDRINNLFGRLLTITVEEGQGRRYLTGTLAGDPEPTMRWTEQGLVFSLVLYCPDPHRYGDWIEYPATSSIIQAENAGDIPTWPILKASGATTITLMFRSQKVMWSGSTSGLTLDFADMQPSQGMITYDDAFQIPPGISNITALASGDCSLLARPGWR